MPVVERPTPAEQPAIEPAADPAEPVVADVERTPSRDTWERLRAGMALDYEDQRSRVRKRAEWFLRKNRKDAFLDRALQRGQHYLPYILDEVERRGLPTELALLPLVESAYHPYAHSNKRAMGLWQFIPATGRIYGLRRNWWYEGRRDVHAATHAALDYLQHLHKEMDGDWLLAVAAYNTGEKNVRRAIARNRKSGKPTHFWALKLPRETRGYVPNLLAVTDLVRAHEHYRFDFRIYPGKLIRRVELDGPIDLALAAELAGISMHTLYALNPATRRWMTPPEGPHRLLLPENSVERFRKRLAALPKSEWVRWVVHPVRHNDTLHRVAAHYGLGEERGLASINRIDGHIPEGLETLRVPAMMYPEKRYRSEVYRSAFESPRPEPGIGSHRLVYRVRKGDSLWLIARRFGVPTAQLRRWNPKVAGKRFLQPGNQLVLWLKAPPGAEGEAQMAATAESEGGDRSSYTVRKGDSLWLIARRFDTTITKLAALNQLNPTRYLRPGMRLRLPNLSGHRTAGAERTHRDSDRRAAADSARAKPERPQRYVVRKGDSLWLIARRFDTSIGELRRLNDIAPGEMLMPKRTLTLTADAGENADTAETRMVRYVVRKGDSLWLIARRFDTSIGELVSWNGLSRKRYLRPGQQLKIYLPAADGA